MEQMSYKGIKIIREDFLKIEFQNNEFNVYFNRKNPVMIGLWRPLESSKP